MCYILTLSYLTGLNLKEIGYSQKILDKSISNGEISELVVSFEETV